MHVNIFIYVPESAKLCQLNGLMSTGEKPGQNFRVNDHVQTFYRFRQNSEYQIIFMEVWTIDINSKIWCISKRLNNYYTCQKFIQLKES